MVQKKEMVALFVAAALIAISSLAHHTNAQSSGGPHPVCMKWQQECVQLQAQKKPCPPPPTCTESIGTGTCAGAICVGEKAKTQGGEEEALDKDLSKLKEAVKEATPGGGSSGGSGSGGGQQGGQQSEPKVNEPVDRSVQEALDNTYDYSPSGGSEPEGSKSVADEIAEYAKLPAGGSEGGATEAGGGAQSASELHPDDVGGLDTWSPRGDQSGQGGVDEKNPSFAENTFGNGDAEANPEDRGPFERAFDAAKEWAGQKLSDLGDAVGKMGEEIYKEVFGSDGNDPIAGTKELTADYAPSGDPDLDNQLGEPSTADIAGLPPIKQLQERLAQGAPEVPTPTQAELDAAPKPQEQGLLDKVWEGVKDGANTFGKLVQDGLRNLADGIISPAEAQPRGLAQGAPAWWPGGSNPHLAEQRAALLSELDTNPELKKRLAAVLWGEAGFRNVEQKQPVLEAMLNRSLMRGYKSLSQAIDDGFYGPVNQGRVDAYYAKGVSTEDLWAADRAVEAVRAGSNVCNYCTDQGQESEIKGRKWEIEGEWFGHVPGGEKWAKQQIAQTAVREALVSTARITPETAALPAGFAERAVPASLNYSSPLLDTPVPGEIIGNPLSYENAAAGPSFTPSANDAVPAGLSYSPQQPTFTAIEVPAPDISVNNPFTMSEGLRGALQEAGDSINRNFADTGRALTEYFANNPGPNNSLGESLTYQNAASEADQAARDYFSNYPVADNVFGERLSAANTPAPSPGADVPFVQDVASDPAASVPFTQDVANIPGEIVYGGEAGYDDASNEALAQRVNDGNFAADYAPSESGGPQAPRVEDIATAMADADLGRVFAPTGDDSAITSVLPEWLRDTPAVVREGPRAVAEAVRDAAQSVWDSVARNAEALFASQKPPVFESVPDTAGAAEFERSGEGTGGGLRADAPQHEAEYDARRAAEKVGETPRVAGFAQGTEPSRRLGADATNFFEWNKATGQNLTRADRKQLFVQSGAGGEYEGTEAQNKQLLDYVKKQAGIGARLGTPTLSTEAPAVGGAGGTLSQWFGSRGESLPSLSERRALYTTFYGLGASYSGTAAQNARLLEALKARY